MTTSGMNPAEVRQMADRLRHSAESLRAIVSAIDGRVSHTSWHGSDADRFRHWWPGHRRLILEAADRIQGLGQSARNNADEQERASSRVGGGAGGSVPVSGSGLAATLGLVAAGGARALSGAARSLVISAPGASPAQAWRNLINDPQVRIVTEASLRRVLGAEVSGATSWGPVPASYRAGAEIYAQVTASRTLTLDSSGLAASAQAGAAIGARADVQGSMGNRYLGTDAGAHAGVAASANAGADVKVGPAGAAGHLGGDIGARAEVGADAHAHLSGVEAGAAVKAYAGLTAHADVTASLTLETVKAHVDLGAAVGLGAGVSFDVNVKPAQLVEDAGDLAEQWTKGWPW